MNKNSKLIIYQFIIFSNKYSIRYSIIQSNKKLLDWQSFEINYKDKILIIILWNSLDSEIMSIKNGQVLRIYKKLVPVAYSKNIPY